MMSISDTIERIKRKYKVIDPYFRQHGDHTIGSVMDAVGIVIQNACLAKDVRSLRQIDNELNRWVREIPSLEHRNAIAAILRNETGEDLQIGENKRRQRVQGIIARGKIRSKGEYALLTEYIEEIYAEPDMAETVELINKLLIDYQR